MCALFGWLDYGKKLPHKTLRKFTQELANAAEERGTDASGISYILNGKVKIYKKANPAHKIGSTFQKVLLQSWVILDLLPKEIKSLTSTITHSMARLTRNLPLLIMEFCIMIRI